MRSADVVMTNPGNALVQCRVADHIAAGMQMLVQVKPSAAAEKEEAAAAADATVTKTYYVQGGLAGQLWGTAAAEACMRRQHSALPHCLLTPPLPPAFSPALSSQSFPSTAEPTEWNYAPSGKDGCTNAPFS